MARARFGMFIHWGLYAIPAQGEWYMNDKVPVAEYAKCAGQGQLDGTTPKPYCRRLMTLHLAITLGLAFQLTAMAVTSPFVDGHFGPALDTQQATLALAGKDEYSQAPLSVECWANLRRKDDWNVIVASRPVQREPVRTRQQGPLTIGFTQHANGTISCDGLVDEVRISKTVRALTGIPAAPLVFDVDTVALWHLDAVPEGAKLQRFAGVSLDVLDRESYHAGPSPLDSEAAPVALKPGAATHPSGPMVVSLDGTWQMAATEDFHDAIPTTWILSPSTRIASGSTRENPRQSASMQPAAWPSAHGTATSRHHEIVGKVNGGTGVLPKGENA